MSLMHTSNSRRLWFCIVCSTCSKTDGSFEIHFSVMIVLLNCLQAYFTDNSGYRGGALALYGRSKIVLMKNSSLLFTGNSAKEKGGAVFVDASGSPLGNSDWSGLHVHACFFTYEVEDVDYRHWRTRVVFEGNKAPKASGQSLYATTLKNCIRAGETRRFGEHGIENPQNHIRVCNSLMLSKDKTAYKAHWAPLIEPILITKITTKGHTTHCRLLSEDDSYITSNRLQSHTHLGCKEARIGARLEN